ncbi:hypothetical protein J4210_04395 [Candidatus Woesearchaeota archaeon]|nr:hypothetical protein [Candidatus Woesearchaeota archaeon]
MVERDIRKNIAPFKNQEDRLSTTYGRELLSWLRGLFQWTPFGISYIHENETGVSVPVEFKDGKINKTTLYATAGVYALEHDPQLSITTTEIAIVASFEDCIKVYSRVATSGGKGEIDIEWYEEVATGPEGVAKGDYTSFEKKRGRIDRNWDDIGLRIQQRCGNFLGKAYSGRPIFYEYIVGDDFGTGRIVKELSGTGFPSYIGGDQIQEFYAQLDLRTELIDVKGDHH